MTDYREHTLAEDKLFDTMRYREALQKLRTLRASIHNATFSELRSRLRDSHPDEYKTDKDSYRAPQYIHNIMAVFRHMKDILEVLDPPVPRPRKKATPFGRKKNAGTPS